MMGSHPQSATRRQTKETNFAMLDSRLKLNRRETTSDETSPREAMLPSQVKTAGHRGLQLPTVTLSICFYQ